MNKFLKKYSRLILFFSLFLFGFILRVILVEKVLVGDLLVYGEWGEKLVTLGGKNFYFREGWYWSYPVYPPIAQLLFGGLYWLFEHKYWLAQLHNLIKIPPAAFIVYFYKWGYILLLKLPSILADLGLAAIIYWLIKKFTQDYKKALAGFLLYLFNPMTIFLSGAWGQTDSLVAIFGLAAFILLTRGLVFLSLPLLFISIYIKFSWIIFIPFYLFVLYLKKPKIIQVISGIVITLALFWISSVPFSGSNVIPFTKEIIAKRFPLPSTTAGKASVSAFNFQTIFFKIDRDLPNVKLLGIPTSFIGLTLFLLSNVFSFLYVKKSKNLLWGSMVGIFMIGFSSFLFMTNMLERYFFPALAPLIVIMFTQIKTLIWGVLINIILFANIIWSFYRRASDEIDHPFTNNNFFLIRVLSLSLLAIWLKILFILKRVPMRAKI